MAAKATESVFFRYEQKYLLSGEQYQSLFSRLEERMERDRFGQYTICSLYCDTADRQAVRHSLEKPYFKEKLRLRSYGVPSPEDTVYLELKKKLAGVTGKRRISLPYREASTFLARRDAGRRGQIQGEISAYLARRPMEAGTVICYDRIALSDGGRPGLRVTFDRNIRWRNHDLDLSLGDHGSPLLAPGQRLMEIKAEHAVPLWLCDILSEHRAYQTSFSKYGMAYLASCAPDKKPMSVAWSLSSAESRSPIPSAGS